MNKKYKLTDETIHLYGKTLHRIECVTSFGEIIKGEKGGFVESESNLSQNGDAWVYDNAKVFGNAWVYDNAKVYDNALVYGNAKVYDNAKVCGNAKVYGNAWVRGNAKVYCNALVYGNAWVFSYAEVCDNAEVYDSAGVSDHAEVCGDTKVFGYVTIRGNAIVNKQDDYIVFKNWWSSGRYFTWTRSNNKWCVGCFYGTGKELIEKAYKDSEVSGKHYEAYVKFVESLNQIQSVC